MPTLADIVTSHKVGLENERDATVQATAVRVADLDALIAQCDSVLTALGAHPEIAVAVATLDDIGLLPVVDRDMTP
jgi:hypothetical protein